LPTPVELSFRFCGRLNAATSEGCPFLAVHNALPFPAVVRLANGAGASVPLEFASLSLAADETRYISLAGAALGSGRQVLNVVADVFDASGAPVRGVRPFAHQPIFVDPELGSATPLSFDEAFLAQRLAFNEPSASSGLDLGGGYTDYSGISGFRYPSSALPASATVQPWPHPDDPVTMAGLPPRLLGPGRGVTGTGLCPPAPHHGERTHRHEEGDEHPPGCASGDGDDDHDGVAHRDRASRPPGDSKAVGAGPSPRNAGAVTALAPLALPAGDPIVRGNLSMLQADGTYKAAWGWTVRAWQQIFGVWIMNGWTYVGGDGSWQINMPVSFSPQVFIDYRPANRFVQLQDASGNVYTWGDTWKLTGDVTDIGGRAADFSQNGDLPNVDKLYVGATDVWEKFYANRMNALRDQPIQVTFPNALGSGHCVQSTDSSGNPVTPYAWSCSQWGDGKIWVIPAHADNFVVQHEIGHSIHSWYWNGNLPPGSGGAHSLSQCYSNGLALTEGFADFLAYWTQFDRGQAAPVTTYANYNIESPDNSPCVGETNETWVSAAFWDMYDTRNDGTDVNTAYDYLNYVDPGATVSVFLGNSRNSMADVLGVVQAGQPGNVQSAFDKLFRLNTIVP
jgi:hypothetical protein